MKTSALASLGLLASACAGPLADSSTGLPPTLKGIGIEQHLNAQVPLDTLFRDESGAVVPLRSYFGRRPVLLAPVYYQCPMLCSQILSGVVTGLRPLSLKPGRDFDIVAISINPSEGPPDAVNKLTQYTRSYSRNGGASGWHFLTGSDASIHAVTDAIGFHFRWDPTTMMFVHASGIMLLTPEGRVARYFYGVEYQPKDLKLGLIEASHNKIGSRVDQILLFCYHYDPASGKYGAVVMNILRLAAALVLAVIVITLILLWRRDIREDRRALSGEFRHS